VLDQIRVPEYQKVLDQGDLEIVFQPLSYERQNYHSQQQFEKQRQLNAITQSDLSEEEKMSRISAVLNEITTLTVTVLAGSIKGIKTPEAFVIETEMITEFLQNCDRKVFNQIKDQVVELRQVSELQPVKIKCNACEHEYEQPLNLDMSDFFEPAS
jgi:chromatin segregation and condensation protein Rec8/ScpA/Scc1 (kleisin family)